MTLSLILPVRLFVSHEGFFLSFNRMFMVFYLVLKSVNWVSRMYKGCLKFQGCFKEFQGRFKEVLRVFTESFKGVSRKFKGCLRKFQECFNEVSRVF